MKKQYLFIIISIILLAGCSMQRDSARAYGSMSYSSESEFGLMASNKVIVEEEIDRKIIFSASISLFVKNPDTVNARIEKIAKKYEGYVTEVGSYKTIVRIKSEKLDLALDEISLLGKIQHQTKRGEDVTEEYLDYKIRLENAENARKRYLELLAKAENVQAALKVEKELERLNGTIDMIKGKMNRIEHLAAFSTITILLKEKKKPGILGYVGIGLYHSVKWLFVRN